MNITISELLLFRKLETLSLGTCRLHGSPKMISSTNVSPHHRLLHHHLHLHRSHSRIQSMDEIPLPFQTDQRQLNILVQESPLLSPNPPPSVVESNSQPLVNISSNNMVTSADPSLAVNNNVLSHDGYLNASSKITTTNVIMNNIKLNSMIIDNDKDPSITVTSTKSKASNKIVNYIK